jgi:hypothetical protein
LFCISLNLFLTLLTIIFKIFIFIWQLTLIRIILAFYNQLKVYFKLIRTIEILFLGLHYLII